MIYRIALSIALLACIGYAVLQGPSATPTPVQTPTANPQPLDNDLKGFKIP